MDDLPGPLKEGISTAKLLLKYGRSQSLDRKRERNSWTNTQSKWKVTRRTISSFNARMRLSMQLPKRSRKGGANDFVLHRARYMSSALGKRTSQLLSECRAKPNWSQQWYPKS